MARSRRAHYAFLIGEEEFDQIFGRIRERGLEHWADPGQRQPGEINRNDGGRGVYFEELRWSSPRNHHPSIRKRRKDRGTKIEAQR